MQIKNDESTTPFEINYNDHKSVTSQENKQKIIKRENLGLFLVLTCYFCRSMNGILLKYIEKRYHTFFSSFTFMLIRSIFVSFLAYIHSVYNNEKILRWSEIKFKTYFFIRTNVHYFSLLLFIIAVWYIRVSTVNIIDTLGPIISTCLSVIVLKEKFYLRYAIGIVICVTGSLIIINNESKVSAEVETTKNETDSKRLIIGCACTLISTLIGSSIDLANKVLANNKVPATTQLMYLGGFNVFYSVLFCLFTGSFKCSFGYVILTFLQGLIHYTGNFSLNCGMELIDLTKIVPVSYTKIVFVLIFGYLFIGEALYFTDIIGASLIISYTLYNLKNPIITTNK